MTIPSPTELVARHRIIYPNDSERTKFGEETASMIEALVKQLPPHEDRVLRMMTEDASKIIDQRGFTRGYKAGLEAGAEMSEIWDCGTDVATSIRSIPVPQAGP